MYSSSYENRGGSYYSGGPKYSEGVACTAPPMAMNVSTGHPYSSHYSNPCILGPTAQWSTGLCHCCDDPASCLVTAFCPCITFGQIAELVSRGQVGCGISGTMYALLMGFTGCACLYSCLYRSRLRRQYDLDETPSADCLVHFCCEPCALCQEYRELKFRGFDMGIGWQANMERQKRGMTVPPQVGTMMR